MKESGGDEEEKELEGDRDLGLEGLVGRIGEGLGLDADLKMNGAEGGEIVLSG